ncbi:MAG: hypothetical protein V1746_06805 [bacterium]
MWLKRNLAPTWTALKHHYLPFLSLQICGVVIIVLYYQWSAFQKICSVIAQWKTEGGLFFAAGTMAVAGAILPEIAKLLTGKLRGKWTRSHLQDVLFTFLYYAFLGIALDLFYRFQSVLFGSDVTLRTVILKTFVDEFLWLPFIDAPSAMLLFLWYQHRFSVLQTRQALHSVSFLERFLPVLLSFWAYWIPLAVCIYSLPLPLQFPFSACATGAWSLLMIFILTADKQKLFSLSPNAF